MATDLNYDPGTKSSEIVGLEGLYLNVSPLC